MPVVNPPRPNALLFNILGYWNPVANTTVLLSGSAGPSLASGGVGGTKNDFYAVLVSGTSTAIDGNTTWLAGDLIVNSGAVWARFQMSSFLSSMAFQSASNVLITNGSATLQTLGVGSGFSTTDDGLSDNALNILDKRRKIIARFDSNGAHFGVAAIQLANAITVTAQTIGVKDVNGNTILNADGPNAALGLPGVSMYTDSDTTVAWRLLDQNKRILFQINTDATVYAGNIVSPSIAGGGGGGSDPTVYSDAEIAERNARALALSTVVGTDTLSARPVWGVNVVLAVGQSLGVGFEAWPRLTKTQPFDNLMFGQSTRSNGLQGGGAPTTWTPVTDSSLHALTATVQNETTGVPINDTDAAALTPGDFAVGESAEVGATNFWRRQQLNLRGLPADSTRRLLAINTGVGGRQISELSKGATPTQYYLRNTTAATALKAVTDAASLTSGLAAIIYMQGENDYAAGTSTATYKTALAQLRTDLTADLQVGIFGQTIDGHGIVPAMFTYQPGPNFVDEVITIGEAFLQLAEAGTIYLAAPVYPVTDKGTHLDPNGERWMGMQFGKVLHKVLDLGQTWMPLYPIQITARDFQILVDFHVPAPPIVFDLVYVGTTATDFAAKGFWVTDTTGDITINDISIVSDTQVLLTIAQKLTGAAYLSYGKKTPYNGYGCLRDSDPTLAPANYEYNAGTGQYAGANIAALVGKPYPLWNWCVNFRRQITVE